METITDISLEVKGNAIPWGNIAEAINKLEYGSSTSIMFKTLLYTGCRISELDLMQPKNILQGYLFWKTGKNQKGYRKEKMPDSWVKELMVYRDSHNCPKIRLFHKAGRSFVDFFNKKIRPQLSRDWKIKRIIPTNNKFAKPFVFQMKGLRKNFQTLKFFQGYRKWNDAYIALECISKDMKHSTKNMTFKHYIENNDMLEIDRFQNLEIHEIVAKSNEQTNLLNYYPEDGEPA